jgi:lambda repressor-like predicted transcriptional regulator
VIHAISDHPVTEEWRSSVIARMKDAGLSIADVARAAGTSHAAVGHVLTKAKSSSLVPRITDAVSMARPAPGRSEENISEAAAVREARDAISADIVRLETARATIEERIAEAYEHRAKLEVKLREIRGEA